LPDSASSSNDLLVEIRDLLRQQNVLLAEIHALNREVGVQTLASIEQGKSSVRDLQALRAGTSIGNIKYFVAFLLFLLLLLSLGSTQLRPLWHFLGL
jgi:hypothetical protein